MEEPTYALAPMDLSKLLSPPDSSPRHTFSHFKLPPMDSSRTAREALGRLPSPPHTPADALSRNLELSPCERDCVGIADDQVKPRDPVLFPSARSESGSVLDPDQSLFPQPVEPPPDKAALNFDAIVEQHMAMHMDQFRDAVNKPTREEYLLALSCIPIASKKHAENPRRWLQQERRILNEHFGGANRIWKKPKNAQLAKIAPAPVAGLKSQGTIKQAVRHTRTPRTPRPAKQTPPSKILDAFEGGNAGTPRRVIGTSREDTDFNSLPDYSPPLSTLPKNNPKALKAEWRGQMLDLSNDPHRHLLHEAELNLAATLRLSCATYLCSKRRIFAARLGALRIGKEFRKTDSQQACKIDVNKASKLWSAYEKVGWFKPEYFQHHL